MSPWEEKAFAVDQCKHTKTRFLKCKFEANQGLQESYCLRLQTIKKSGFADANAGECDQEKNDVRAIRCSLLALRGINEQPDSTAVGSNRKVIGGKLSDMHSAHSDAPLSAKALRYSLAATFAYVLITLVAGLTAHSLALLSEAGHNVTDLLALLLSWVAVFIQTRPPSATKTFGYHRAGVLAAFVNALTLVAISFYIFYEALMRIRNPVTVHPQIMIWVAVIGVLMNGVISWVLFRASRDVNIRSAFVHQLGDTLSTAAVIVGGWAILWTGRTWIDPALSIGIACLILWSSFGIIRETLNILLEGAPHGLSAERVSAVLSKVEGVRHVHDVHVWSIGSDTHALSCHIRIDDITMSESQIILRRVRELLSANYHIEHTTIQMENVDCEVAHGCVIPIGQLRTHEPVKRSR
jgi:cobalt-zinc-cadmium efflux system protein